MTTVEEGRDGDTLARGSHLCISSIMLGTTDSVMQTLKDLVILFLVFDWQSTKYYATVTKLGSVT